MQRTLGDWNLGDLEILKSIQGVASIEGGEGYMKEVQSESFQHPLGEGSISYSL